MHRMKKKKARVDFKIKKKKKTYTSIIRNIRALNQRISKNRNQKYIFKPK